MRLLEWVGPRSSHRPQGEIRRSAGVSWASGLGYDIWVVCVEEGQVTAITAESGRELWPDQISDPISPRISSGTGAYCTVMGSWCCHFEDRGARRVTRTLTVRIPRATGR